MRLDNMLPKYDFETFQGSPLVQLFQKAAQVA